MFGLYRTLLALLVVFEHLGGFGVIGAYAVFGFYILSGYLMTFIIQTSYGYSLSGVGRYALNRFLRIYPIYWVSIAISVVLILWLGSDVPKNFHPHLYLPQDTGDWLRNVLLAIAPTSTPRLTPPSWALSVELVFYTLIGLGMFRNRWHVLAWFLGSCAYHAWVNAIDLGWEWRYFYVPAAALPFSTGALIFHFKDWLGVFTRFARWAPLVFAAMLFNWYIWHKLGVYPMAFFYFNYVLHAAIVLLLATPGALAWMPKKLDDFLGQFSYPIYLVHYQAGLIVVGLAQWWAGVTLNRHDSTLLVLTLPLIIALAWVITMALEQPIELIRDRVAGRRKTPPANDDR